MIYELVDWDAITVTGLVFVLWSSYCQTMLNGRNTIIYEECNYTGY